MADEVHRPLFRRIREMRGPIHDQPSIDRLGVLVVRKLITCGKHGGHSRELHLAIFSGGSRRGRAAEPGIRRGSRRWGHRPGLALPATNPRTLMITKFRCGSRSLAGAVAPGQGPVP